MDLVDDRLRRSNQIGGHLMRWIATGMRQGYTMRDETAVHVGLFRSLLRFSDQQRELGSDFDLFRIAPGGLGMLVQRLDSLGDLVERPPAWKPTLTNLGCPLDRLETVAADVKRKRILLRLRKHLDVLIRVIFSAKGRHFFGRQFLEYLKPLFHHIAAVRMRVPIAGPGLEFFPICAEADRHHK